MHSKEMKLPYPWMEEILNIAAEWIVVVDREGLIRYINPAYCEFLKTSQEEAFGKPVDEVIENTRLPVVMKTLQPEIGEIHPIQGSEMIANRYPLYLDGELVGAVGTVIYRNPKEWRDFSRKIQPLIDELHFYKEEFEKELRSKYTFDHLIGEHPAFIEAKRLAERVSVSKSAVLLMGESGTGKELFAHAIHDTSQRRKRPFIRVNCASIPDHLLESELFGYEEGAFTGAKRGGKKGKFELAHRGTILLDEIGDMPLAMQTKILRVLQEKEIERVGGQGPIPIDVRIIAATHRNLDQMVQEGTFRQDLYYRLNVMKIEIPPLRERISDVPLLAEMLLKKLETKFYKQGLQLSAEVKTRLLAHHWPGNIRELENVLERAINILDWKVIELKHLPLYLQDATMSWQDAVHIILPDRKDHKPAEKPQSMQSLRDILAEAEKEALIQALHTTGGKKQEAAQLLGIGKTSFYDKCKEYGIK